MSCCHYALVPGNESAFSVDLSAITFGPGVHAEAGVHLHAAAPSCKRVALFTDATLARLESVDVVRRSLTEAGLDVVVYSEVHVEPTDVSFRAAADFAREGRFDGYVSVGGGSVIDTCKAALLYA
ncbi:MAG: iron-containing alcohol dehydrogenase, partial [Polyangiaceae bacterium]